MGSRRRSRARRALLVCFAWLACASTEPPRPTPPDAAEIQALPGYRGGFASTASFPGRAWVTEAGPEDGRAVLLIHGISRDGAHDWDGLVPVLAASRRVLTFDLPGFGRSERSPAVLGPREFADFVDDLIAARVSGEFDVVGHSMGVSVALEVAARHPDRVGRLVLADAAAILHGHAVSIGGMRSGQARLGALGRLFDPLRQGAYDLMGWVPDYLVHRFAIAIQDGSAGEAAARLMAHDSGAALDGVRAPSLIVWGEDDRVASRRGAWTLAARLPDTRLAFVPGGHTPMQDAPEIFQGLVADWLAGQDVGVALAPAVVPSERVGVCRGVRTRYELSGAYGRIEIERCRDVVLSGVRAREIEIVDSEVVANDLRVAGDQVGMMLWGSRLEVSGGSVSADVGLRLSKSEVDLAGVTIRARQASVEAIGDAKVLCSLCRLERSGLERRLHGFRSLKPPDRL